MDLFCNAPEAKDEWKAVEDYSDSWNPSTVHHIVHSFFSTKIQDKDVHTDHISTDEQKHTCATDRCRSGNDLSPHRDLLEYTKSIETKACNLPMSHPASRDNFIHQQKKFCI